MGSAIRSAQNDAVGFTPNYFNFGREVAESGQPQLGGEAYLPEISSRETYVERFKEVPSLYNEVVHQLQRAYEPNARKYNLRRRPITKPVGATVWKKTNPLSNKTINITTLLVLTCGYSTGK